MKKKKTAPALRLTHVTKTYTLWHEKPTLSEQLLRRKRKEQFAAVKNISLTLYKGERVGIIGDNGSGKTTLLKIMTGITTPSSGAVKRYDKVLSLIDVQAGFHNDLTGLENIYLNGLVLGMRRKEIDEKLQDIIVFADIGSFIDAPLHTYSYGMKLRLGFAVAVHAEPDTLLLDEGVAAGDQDFQAKLEKKVKEFAKQGKTLIIVSHWLDFLAKHCQRIIWIEDHQIKADGGKKLLTEYKKHSLQHSS